MRKIFFFLCISFFGVSFVSALPEEGVRKIKIDEKLIWEATSEVIDDLGVLVKETKFDGVTPTAKRKKKKRFFKRLIRTIVNLAAKLAVKEAVHALVRDHIDLMPLLVKLCHDLYDVLSVEEKDFFEDGQFPMLSSIFAIDDEEQRVELIEEKLSASPQQINLFLQELLGLGFSFCSESLKDLIVQFQNRAMQTFTVISDDMTADPIFRSVEALDPSCQVCYNIARLILKRVQLRSIVIDTRETMPAILAILRVISSVGGLVCDDTRSCSGSSRDDFLERSTALARELCDYLSCDGLLESLKKLSSFLSRLDAVQTKEERLALTEEFLRAPDRGREFLKDTFANVNIYLQEALSKVFSRLFCQLSDVMCV